MQTEKIGNYSFLISITRKHADGSLKQNICRCTMMLYKQN